MGLEDEAEELLKYETIGDQLEERDGTDYTALHHAANLGCAKLVGALLQAKADVNSQCGEINGSLFVPGGRSPLHLAVSNGDEDTISTILACNPRIDCKDWENETPLALATSKTAQTILKNMQKQYYASLPGDQKPPQEVMIPLDKGSVFSRQRKRIQNTKARRTRNLDISDRKQLHKPHILKNVWSEDVCQRVLNEVLRITAKHGWTSKRHSQYPTTDIPIHEVPSVFEWVRHSIVTDVFAKVARKYKLSFAALKIRDAFYVKYSSDPGAQRGLGLHRDGSLLSCNVLLNKSSEFEGGGTIFHESSEGKMIMSGKRGDFLIHSGQLLHGGREV
eukprot:CAMPEP_0114491364 /NCGR_PEP_ID=MMETSP0109-20121206/2961_1 /TAXON_ID=29199 /ORGANISM="Chlorarachnion reptans, Strain CCCM449" /LENGTH=333 /DNA_ID=CAMNT_0001668093 /DNA_START=91 /DNA_END=1090 /DNA_ORIENTATION=+